MTDSDPRLAESNRRTSDPSGQPTDADRNGADRDSADRDDRDTRPRMRDVDQTGPDELDANGVWSRGPAAPTEGSDDAAPADD